MVEGIYKQWFTLTVAEGKRLIALGIKAYSPLAEKLHAGNVMLAKGTTNTYIYEALMDVNMAHGNYVNGFLKPSTSKFNLEKDAQVSELVLKDGQIHPIAYPDALNIFQKGDIVLKGANIINYQKQQAGVMIMHPTGGTCGNIIPAIEQRQLRLIIPVGLEKDCSQDIKKLSEETQQQKQPLVGNTPWLWFLEGELFTEIEALKQLATVDVQVIGKGGIGGAEGAITFCVSGEKHEVECIMTTIKNIQGEESYVK